VIERSWFRSERDNTPPPTIGASFGILEGKRMGFGRKSFSLFLFVVFSIGLVSLSSFVETKNLIPAKTHETFHQRLEWYFDSVLDFDGDGLVGLTDLKEFAKLFEEDSETEVSEENLEANVSPQASWLINRLDKNGDNAFDKDEFIRGFGDSDTSGKQVHLAWTPDPSSVIVIWITDGL